MNKTIFLIGTAGLAALAIACSSDDSSGPEPLPGGDGDGDAASGSGGGTSTGSGGGTSTGDGDGTSTGDGDGPTGAAFVVGGRGTSADETWDGYTFAVAGDNSTIMPTEFTGSELCVTGELGASYEEWALVGWNIAQEIDPETFEGGAVNAIAPGGSGVNVTVQNNGGSGLRVQIQTDDQGTESWCVSVPETGTGVIPWSDFTKECWSPGGEAYDPSTPIAQIAIQTYAGSETMPTAFDYCVLDIQPAP